MRAIFTGSRLSYLSLIFISLLFFVSIVEAADGGILNGGRALVGVQLKVGEFDDSDAKQILSSGFDFVRMGVWIDRLSDSNYRKKVDESLNIAVRGHVKVFLTVRNISFNKSISPQKDGYQFGRAVSEFIRNHPENILAVELWNEPEFNKNWPWMPYRSTFSEFMIGACKALKDEPLGVPVAGFAFSKNPVNYQDDADIIKKIISSQPGCLTAISVHDYNVHLADVEKMVYWSRKSYGLPLIISEWGIPATLNRGGEDGQASEMSSVLGELTSSGISAISIYQWKDINGGVGREDNFGLKDHNGRNKPALEIIAPRIKELKGVSRE